MRGLKVGLLVGAIMGNKRRRKNDGQIHQPGGCLLYIGIPVVGTFGALNTLAFEMDGTHAPLFFVGFYPALILLGTIAATLVVAWVRKVDREEQKKQMELRRQRWLEHLQNPRPLFKKNE